MVYRIEKDGIVRDTVDPQRGQRKGWSVKMTWTIDRKHMTGFNGISCYGTNTESRAIYVVYMKSGLLSPNMAISESVLFSVR